MTQTKCRGCGAEFEAVPDDEEPDLCDECFEAEVEAAEDRDPEGESDAELAARDREAAHERGMETWARAYDELNGAPESEEDR